MDTLRILETRTLRTAWHRRWIGVLVAWLACLLGWSAVWTLPSVYQSNARLYVDADAVLTPLLHGLAADTSPASQLEMLQRTLLSRPNLERLVSKTDLGLSVNEPDDRENLIKHLGHQIIVQSQARNLFTIEYGDRSPQMAHDVVQTLLNIFIEDATGNNRSDMENARRFLQQQIASYEQQLRTMEQRRAAFRAEYIDVLGGEGGHGSSVEAARSHVNRIEDQLLSANAEANAIKQQVEVTPRMLTADGVGPGAAAPSPLAEAQDRLRELQLRFTDAFPDVIAQKKLIAALKAQHGNRSAASGGGVRQSWPNPVFDQLKVKQIEVEAQIASLIRQRETARAYLAKVETMQREQPSVLAEYQNMDRDYGVLRRNYDELLARLHAANIAEAADTQADKVQLRVVDPPEVPRLPISPNRILLVTGVLVAGLGAGAGACLLLAQLDRSFATVEQLRDLGLPVLGGLSVVGAPSTRTVAFGMARFALALLGLAIIYGGVLARMLKLSAML